MTTIRYTLDHTVDPYAAILVCQTHLAIKDIQEEIDNTLAHISQSRSPLNGRILLDTLFHAGNGQGRFLDVNVTGSIVDWSTLRPVIVDKRSPIRTQAADMYEKEAIRHSALTTVQKNLLSKGAAI